MKTIDIGILGLGTVGSGVVKILQDNRSEEHTSELQSPR